MTLTELRYIVAVARELLPVQFPRFVTNRKRV